MLYYVLLFTIALNGKYVHSSLPTGDHLLPKQLASVYDGDIGNIPLSSTIFGDECRSISALHFFIIPRYTQGGERSKINIWRYVPMILAV